MSNALFNSSEKFSINGFKKQQRKKFINIIQEPTNIFHCPPILVSLYIKASAHLPFLSCSHLTSLQGLGLPCNFLGPLSLLTRQESLHYVSMYGMRLGSSLCVGAELSFSHGTVNHHMFFCTSEWTALILTRFSTLLPTLSRVEIVPI